jgi:hypothetical protein
MFLPDITTEQQLSEHMAHMNMADLKYYISLANPCAFISTMESAKDAYRALYGLAKSNTDPVITAPAIKLPSIQIAETNTGPHKRVPIVLYVPRHKTRGNAAR